MNTNFQLFSTITQIIIIIALVYLIYRVQTGKEQLCIKQKYGYVTDVPVSTYVDANMALVHSTSLGQAPLGDPHYWLKNRSPITQGQYGLYRDHTLPLSETQPFDRKSLMAAAAALPVYTQKPLPPQCTPLN